MVVHPAAASRQNLIQRHAGSLTPSASIDLLLVDRDANCDLRTQDVDPPYLNLTLALSPNGASDGCYPPDIGASRRSCTGLPRKP